MQQNSLQNLFQNLTKRQKIGILISLFLIIILLFYIFFITQNSSENTSQNNEEDATESEINIEEINYNPDSSTKESSNNYIQELINNDYQYKKSDPNYYLEHTTNPELLSTYLPHIEYRYYILDETQYRSVYFYAFQKDEKTIEIMVEKCDEEQDKIRANNYLNSLPLDLSQFTIEYNINTEAYCGK